MNKKKIFNDPVYGFVSVPYGIIFELIEHPYFQRLRRIKQVSLTHYVYPGALHTRFHHALGAMHLMQEAIEVLRSKGVEITEEEATASCIAILLHDIGHGPFSHTLEHTLIKVHHEDISILFMEKLNEEFDGALDMALAIFKGDYHKPFLHQLISGQLDMDRLDYLSRDSFFTGVSEGVVSYGRIIKMLSVHEGQLVVEEKGIYSIEKFIIARRLMYWQVYLHKTVLSAEQMLIRAFQRARDVALQGVSLQVPESLGYFLDQEVTADDFAANRDELLEHFARLDDYDIVSALKTFQFSEDRLLAFLAESILNRRLNRLIWANAPFSREQVAKLKQEVMAELPFSEKEVNYLVFEGTETNSAYSTSKDEIAILFKDGTVRPMSQSLDYGIQAKLITKHYLCYPKNPEDIRARLLSQNLV
ncbi:MAG: HD domain-containing protein [Phaeodactylibacter sp.]|nr:HD domain-containing protein [Phaeodactylibacter sp.]